MPSKPLKILVLGSGGREHALVWKLAQSPLKKKIYCAPGNPGIATLAECVPIQAHEIDALAAFAQRESIDLTIVGPELPLTLGIADRFHASGLKIVGPSKAAARLEGSKAFAKEVLLAAGIPTAAHETASSMAAALSFIKDYFKKHAQPLVLKADGLASGKGVVIAQTESEALQTAKAMLEELRFGDAGKRVVMEEFLEGKELSMIVLTDGERVLPLEASRDHKRVGDGDTGPNTGGMGAYAPVPELDAGLQRSILKEIFTPTLAELKRRGILYQGFLYAGLMLTDEGPKVLEFNARLGDPEAQVVLMQMKSDLLPVLMALGDGSLKGQKLAARRGAAVCVVMAAEGYPEKPARGALIEGLEKADALDRVAVFHAGTRMENKRYLTQGGRVLGVTAMGKDLEAARKRAYEAAGRIRWQGCHYRKDIGKGLA